MSNPWMKFYPSDWRSDPRLRLCSIAARGLWAEMIALMHEAEPYGHLLVNGKTITNKQLGSLVGCSTEETTTLLLELEQEGVYSVTIDGIIFSRRMVRDFEKARRDKENGGKGGNPSLNPEDKAGVNPPDNGEDKAQKLEAKARIQKEDSDFEDFLKVYPKRGGSNPRPPALKAFQKAIQSGVDPPRLIAAAKRYAEAEKKNVGTEFIPMAASWLNKRYFEQYFPDPGEIARVAAIFRARPGSPQFLAWKTYWQDSGKAALVRELNQRELENRGFDFESEWPPGKWQKPGEAA